MNPPYAAALTLSAIVSMVVMIIAWRRRSSAGAVALTVAMLGLTVWAFTYAVRWLSSNQTAQYFWLDATYFGVVITPTAFLILAVQFTSPANKFIQKHLGLFFIEPVVTVLILWTDPWHGLFYAGMQSTGTILNGGVWFWVNVIYSYILLLIALGLLIQAFRNATNLVRKQVGVMVAGMLLPWIGNVIGLTHISPFPELDLTPILFIGSGVMFAQGLFHYRLLDIVPIARHKLVESMSDGVIVLDTQHRIVDINPAAQRIAGLSEIGIGQFADETFMPWTTLSQVLRTETETSTEIQVNQASPQNYEVRISPLEDQHQNLTGRLIILRNITKRMHIDEELRKSEERFRSVVQTATDAIVTADASGKIVTWNRGAVNIFQYSETEILGRPLTLLMPEVYRDKHQAGMQQLATGGEPHIIGQIVKIIGLRKDGVEIPIELVLSKWQSGKEMFFTGIIRDISERQKLEDTLLYQSTHDFLTGLFNRQYFETEIERLQQNRKFPISILMMDVDGLKKINDTLGHSAGDDLLRRLAQVLRDVFRREDLVARIGGDEFVAILPNTNSAMAIQVMQRLKSSIDQNNLNYPAYQTLNLSIGAACRDESSSLDEILKLADQAMYLEKQRKTIG
ncbi:MAG: hypothetical protein CVU39_25035 [Chloroflexi bacterium HGW-Chloroflexi-10]|nr:MAG: hypothetical protein CVU39_25035 [Chloroflexi bacterium HGW-Chloroflexi-10]